MLNRKTKKIKNQNKNTKKNNFSSLKKNLGKLYNEAMFEKIPYVFKSRQLNNKEKERFSYVYSLNRSGAYLYLNKQGKIDFNYNWFPNSEKESIRESIKSVESFNWKDEDPTKIIFYEMKELNDKYTDKIYRSNLLIIKKNQ